MAEEYVEYHQKIRTHSDTLESALHKRLEGIKDRIVNDHVKRMAADIYKDCVEPLVPCESHALRDSAKVGEKKYKGDYPVVYDIKYAQAQYEGYNGRGAIRNSNRHTSGTYDHWNHHMSRADRQAFYDLVKEAILEEAHRG